MKRMKTKIVALLAGVGLMAALLVGPAFAASPNQTTLGTPGDPNCVGQTTAFLAQLAQNEGAPIPPGIGNLANYASVSVQQLHQEVEAYCTGP